MEGGKLMILKIFFRLDLNTLSKISSTFSVSRFFFKTLSTGHSFQRKIKELPSWKTPSRFSFFDFFSLFILLKPNRYRKERSTKPTFQKIENTSLNQKLRVLVISRTRK